jgi:hypothetical protein
VVLLFDYFFIILDWASYDGYMEMMMRLPWMM